MSRSFAPSPTATTRSSGSPCSCAHRRRWCSLAARSTTGPVVRPVSRPPSTSSRLATTWSMPSPAAIGPMISRNPPETRPTFPPRSCTSATSSRAPADSSTAARTSSTTPASSPARVATRSRRLAAKSSSPRIARSVTAATCSRVPACSASSSMTSAVMNVESTSMTSRPTPSRASGPLVTPTSTPSAVAGPRSSAARAVSTSAAVPGRGVPVSATPDQPGREVATGASTSATVASSPRACSTSDGGTGRAETRPMRITRPGYGRRALPRPFGSREGARRGDRRSRRAALGGSDDREGRPWVGAPGYRYGPGGLPAHGGALGHERDAGLGDGEAALEGVLEVDPDLCAVGDTHVLVDDRPVDHGVAPDVDVGDDHRVPHRGPGVDAAPEGDPDLWSVGVTHLLVDDRPVDHGVAADVDVVEDHRGARRGPGVDLRTGGDHRPHDLTAGDDDTRRDERVECVTEPLAVPVDELRRRHPRVAGEQRPLLVVEVEDRGDRDEVLVGVVVGVDRADVAPVAVVTLRGSRHDVVLEVVDARQPALDEPRHDAAAHVV